MVKDSGASKDYCTNTQCLGREICEGVMSLQFNYQWNGTSSSKGGGRGVGVFLNPKMTKYDIILNSD